MKIAVYTLTRDRLAFTQLAFDRLRQRSGYPFHHFVVDNGSQDETPEYLKDELQAGRIHHVTSFGFNAGISHGSNTAIRSIFDYANPTSYDLIVKFDNDCIVDSHNILKQMVEIYESIPELAPRYILSPAVEGINKQPLRGRFTQLGGRRVGIVGIVGGLFRCVPRRVYENYRYPETLPLAKGQDDHFCDWARKHGAELGYVEGLVVKHHLSTDGQAKVYPEYFERKWKEEQQPPAVCQTCETVGIINCPDHMPF